MPEEQQERLMRWNGSEWVEVTRLVRNEVTGTCAPLLVDIGLIRKDLNVNYDVRVSSLTKL